jgi:class 3 adenylate cyclase
VESACIIFTDIVGFAKISLDLAPIDVMDMIQDLFSRFDALCDMYGVLKLETIGDAYICSTGLMEEDDDEKRNDGGRDAAIRALDMARDMVLTAQEVRVPRGTRGSNDAEETLQIRVGIHVGPITAGVLGHRMPKFSVFGSSVNMAARMEQTSLPGKIRVTENFHDLVGDYENGWEDRESIEVKNMGEVLTYLLNPAV